MRGLPGAVLVVLLGCDNTINSHFSGSRIVDLIAATDLQGMPAAVGLSIHLTWTDNATGEEAYRVEVNDAPFGSAAPLQTHVLPAESTAVDLPTQPNGTYYLRIFATFGTQSSPPSNVIAVTTPDVPLPPSFLTATPVSGSRIDLAWFNPPGVIAGNRLELSLDGGTTWTTKAVFGSATTATSATGLSPDTTYAFRVTASNSNGESGPSTPASATTLTASMTFKTSASAANVGQFCSLAVGPGDAAHLAHFDATNTNLVYSADLSDPLPVMTVDSGPTGSQSVGGDGTGIAIDASGYLHLVAHDSSNGKLRYVTNSSGSFVATTLDAVGFNGQAPKICYSGSDNSIHLVYLNDLAGSDTLRHASRTLPGGSWGFEDILPSTTTLDSWAVTAAGGVVHISYSHTDDGITYELVHGTRSGSWSFTSITSAARPGWNSIAIDGGGIPHVAYFEKANVRLMYATRVGGVWVTQEIHGVAGTDLGRQNSIAVNASTGQVHVAYYDFTNGDLRYARKDPGNAWVLRLVDTIGDVGGFPSISTGSAGAVLIGYFDETNHQLKLAIGSP